MKNFHPYEKAIEAIIKCIEFHIGKDDFDDRLIEDKLEELDRVILLYEEAYKFRVVLFMNIFTIPKRKVIVAVNIAIKS